MSKQASGTLLKSATFSFIFGETVDAKKVATFLLLFGLLLDDLCFSDSFYFLPSFYDCTKRTRYEIKNSGNNAKSFQKIILVFSRNDAPSDRYNFFFDNFFNRFDIKHMFMF